MIPPTPLNGATQGMPGAAPNPMAAEFQEVIARARTLIAHMKASPGVDQPKLDQGLAMLGQAMQLIAASIQKPGQPPPQPPPPG